MTCTASDILVVDDDPDVRVLLKHRLERLSYNVRTAADGDEGLAIARRDPPDLMLLDLQMPRMDGLSVLRKLSEDSLPTTVIVISAHGTARNAIEAMKEGAEDFIMKPFDAADVERGLAVAIDRIQQRREQEVREEAERQVREQLVEELHCELQAAHDMQMGLLPADPPDFDGFDISGICIPASYVGGDYYQFLPLDDHRLAIIMADVSGKGMQAATVAMRLNEMVRYEVARTDEPADMLDGLDRSLRGHIPDVMFVTCGIGILDNRTSSLTFASAGNPEVYHYRAARRDVVPLEVNGLPLGLPIVPDGMTRFNTTTVDLEPGDVIVSASDGVEEGRNWEGNFYGDSRLQEAIRISATSGGSSDEIRNQILTDAMEFTSGVGQMDDVTVVVVRQAICKDDS